jgi:Cu+-exporting ATPase
MVTERALPEGKASGVMKKLGLRCEDMNRSQLAGTAQVHTTTLSIGGMSCGACVRHLASGLEELSGVLRVQVDLKRNQATVEHWPDQADAKRLIAAVKVAGYTARVEATSDGAFDVSESTAAGRSAGCCCR